MASQFADDGFSLKLRELTAVQDEQKSVPKHDFARRQDLIEREARLRSELRAYSAAWTDHLSIDQLRRLISQAERRIAEHYGNRLSHTSGAQTGYGGGLDPQVLHWMHRAMDQAGDLAGMKAQLARLKDKLATLEGT